MDRCEKHGLTRIEHGDPDPYAFNDKELEMAHCIGTCDVALCCDGISQDGCMWTEHPYLAMRRQIEVYVGNSARGMRDRVEEVICWALASGIDQEDDFQHPTDYNRMKGLASLVEMTTGREIKPGEAR